MFAAPRRRRHPPPWRQSGRVTQACSRLCPFIVGFDCPDAGSAARAIGVLRSSYAALLVVEDMRRSLALLEALTGVVMDIDPDVRMMPQVSARAAAFALAHSTHERTRTHARTHALPRTRAYAAHARPSIRTTHTSAMPTIPTIASRPETAAGRDASIPY